MSIRILIKIFITLQLTLLIIRQMIDFAGIQWLMIMVNAVSIIITITAFFGYLMLYASFQLLLIVYNIFVICVYARLIVLHSGEQLPFTSDYPIEYHGTESYHSDSYPITTTRTGLPSTQLLSFDTNSRSFWYVIVGNHMSELHSMSQPVLPDSFRSNSVNALDRRHHSPSSTSSLDDESLVDIFVQYIEIFSAAIHIFFSLCGIGLVALKHKLERDKLFRNNDKTTPPLPPYTISPQMNHYMSYTPTNPFNQTTSTKDRSSIYTSNSQNSLRRSKRRRSTRSLHNSKSKANSMGALNIRSSTGSLRSMAKHQHRKSTTSLLMNDTSFSNNTIGSRGGGGRGDGTSGRKSSQGMYQTLVPSRPPPTNGPPPPSRHSAYIMTSDLNTTNTSSSYHHAAKFLTSDSETDYYHTFTPNYVNNGLHNPLYGNRHSYLNDSETAI